MRDISFTTLAVFERGYISSLTANTVRRGVSGAEFLQNVNFKQDGQNCLGAKFKKRRGCVKI